MNWKSFFISLIYTPKANAATLREFGLIDKIFVPP